MEQQIGGLVSDVLPDGGDVTVSLRDALAGKQAAVLVFWSGVCSHCVRYDDYLNTFAARHPQVELIVIACRQGETRDDVRATAAGRGLNFPIRYDEDRAVAHAWFVPQTPRAFLVDARGRLLYRGAIDNFKYPQDPQYRAFLEQAIDEFLAGRPISRAETPGFGCAIESVYYSLPRPTPA
jgi:hypothetical protein